jgi:CBS domain-containing protein
MILSEVMTRQLQTISPDATVQEAAEKMRSFDIGILPVSENHKLVGTLTDRDISIRAVARGRDPWKTKTREIMTTEVVTCYEDQPVEDAARLMEKNHLHRLLVVTREDEPVGIFSIGDLAVQSGNDCLTGEVVRFVAEPYRHKR